jgi:spore coat polysaccharide biosynthesis protein SpsF
LTLGTAQFGMPYGIANRTGVPGRSEIARIVHRAIDHGVTHIDTARLYGESEARLGEALAAGWRRRVSLITKLAPIAEGEPATARSAVDASVRESCRALRVDHLDILLLHRAATRLVADGAAWQRLLELKREGVVGSLGVSAQSPEEAELAAADPDVDAIQLPFNLLDHRWREAPPRRRKLLVHARSIFLQGLLAGAPPERWPRIPGLDIGALVTTLEALVRELGRRSMADLAISFARAHGWIHSLVLGIETEAQLTENLAIFAAPPLDEAAVATIRRRLPVLPDRLLDPARWAAS